MRVRAFFGGLALVGGCQELPDPDWLLDATPTMLAVRVEVVAEGPLSALVGPTPSDRQRTEALPGDTIAFIPWVTSDTRTWAPSELDVAYFVCLTFDCYTALTMQDADLPCRDELDPLVQICAAGRGADATYHLPTQPLSAAIGRAQLIAIAGMPGRGNTDDCIETMRRRPRGDLSDCMLLERRIVTGPYWVVTIALDPEDKLPEPADPDAPTLDEIAAALAAYMLPLEVLATWPNFNPEVERFEVRVSDERGATTIAARAGDTIEVAVGDLVEVKLQVDPRDRQTYAAWQDEDGTIRREGEFLLTKWFANREIAPFSESLANLDQLRRWRVATGDGPTRIDVLLRDSADGTAWGSLHFEVDGADTDE